MTDRDRLRGDDATASIDVAPMDVAPELAESWPAGSSPTDRDVA